MLKDRFNKNFIRFFVITIIFCCTFSITFAIGVFYNPNFTLQDFCMNLASELLGIVITVGIVDSYIRTRNKYYEDIMWSKKHLPLADNPNETKDKANVNDLNFTKEVNVMNDENRFEIISDENLGTKKRVSILRDKQTGIQYLYFINTFGGCLTPLLDKDGKPIAEAKVDAASVGNEEKEE